MKVFINNKSIHGIARVVEAQYKYLPKHGIELVSNPKQAEVVVNHGAENFENGTAPIVNHNHGMFWSRQPWEFGYQEVNSALTERMARAKAHTAPSYWVADALRRGMYIYPEVVYHGVDADEFRVGDSEGYVLWNKARPDYVSDPNDLMKIARKLAKVPFKTTIGRKKNNVDVIGVIPYLQMKEVLASAGVYLATARETFGIGTLEALASGVPIAGWNWGGQTEIVKQGETGYLAHPGNWDELAECIMMCLNERDRLSPNCVEDARERWGWEHRIWQYSEIYKRVYEMHYAERPKVSIIITTYKLDEYLPECLRSVLTQTYQEYECIVVDDANLESTKTIFDSMVGKDKRFSYHPTPHNLGLPGARNFGLSLSKGHYIRHLDADDLLEHRAVEIESGELDKDNGVHIAYGHLALLENGEVQKSGWPEEQYDWYKQMAHLNQIPSCAMARREVYERSGGYRDRMDRNEDAEFWCRVTSLGFRAKKVTQAITYIHRMREDSKGSLEWKHYGSEPDWTAWFPWRLGGHDMSTGRYKWKKFNNAHPNPHLVPFGAQGNPPPNMKSWYIHDYAYPVVSIIVTCGPGHEQYILDALDSIQAQTYTDWECIVVNDTGKEWSGNIMGAPWAHVVSTGGNRGASAARNKGFSYARGEYIIWMDADDYWLPWLLERMVAYAENNAGVIFSDFIDTEDNKKFTLRSHGEFQQARVLVDYCYAGSSVLYPRQIVKAVFDVYGGWDTDIPGKEDWDWQIAVHTLGFCAYRVPEGLFVYRRYTTTKRAKDDAKIKETKAYIDKKWVKYRLEGEKIMCGCSGKSTPRSAPGSAMSASGNFMAQDNPADFSAQTNVDVEYMGDSAGKITIRSRVAPDVNYRFDNNLNKIKTVFMADAQRLISMRDAENRPIYRMLSGEVKEGSNDPSAVLGAPVGV